MYITEDTKQYIEKHVSIPDYFLTRVAEIMLKKGLKAGNDSHTIEQFKNALPARIRALKAEDSQEELNIQEYVRLCVDTIENTLFGNQYFVEVFEFCYDGLMGEMIEDDNEDYYGYMALACKVMWEVGIKEIGIKEREVWEAEAEAGIRRAESSFRNFVERTESFEEDAPPLGAPSAFEDNV